LVNRTFRKEGIIRNLSPKKGSVQAKTCGQFKMEPMKTVKLFKTKQSYNVRGSRELYIDLTMPTIIIPKG